MYRPFDRYVCAGCVVDGLGAAFLQKLKDAESKLTDCKIDDLVRHLNKHGLIEYEVYFTRYSLKPWSPRGKAPPPSMCAVWPTELLLTSAISTMEEDTMFSKEILTTVARMRNGRIAVDAYIREEVIMLNKLGIRTYFCCAGHPRTGSAPYIVFDFSRCVAQHLLSARKLGRTAIVTVSDNAGHGLVLIARPQHTYRTVKYRLCRMFKQYLRNVITVIRNPDVLKESNRRTAELSKKLGLPVYRASEVS